MLSTGGVSVFPCEFSAFCDAIAEDHFPLLTCERSVNLLVDRLEEKTVLDKRARES